jgi:hypothetical protein
LISRIGFGSAKNGARNFGKALGLLNQTVEWTIHSTRAKRESGNLSSSTKFAEMLIARRAELARGKSYAA